MPQNFIEGSREQGFLLPPDVRDWLPADHLAWFVIDAVPGMDLSAFYAAYRADGHGAAAYEPSVMVTLVLYSVATGVRSSRQIEGHCRQDVAYRVITGNLVPDHATVSRFICRHEHALADLFNEVLRLCDEAGLVKPDLVAIDGTRMAANANSDSTRVFEQIALEILAEVRETDEAEDREHGDQRGDELPEQLRTPEGRREFFADAKRKLQHKPSGQQQPEEERAGGELEAGAGPEFEFDEQRIVSRTQGREGWRREGRRQLEQHRWADPEPVPRSRPERLLIAAQRLEQELETDQLANREYELARERRRKIGGHRVGGPPKPYQPPEVPDGKVNVTDPDSRRLKAREGYIQGFNAQAVVDAGQLVLAAEITNSNVDWSHLDPMITAAIGEFQQAGIKGRIETALADAQYWNEEHMDEVIANKHIQVLIPPDGSATGKQRAGWQGGRYTWMRTVLATEHGGDLYRKRKQMIEPVFGHTRHNRGVTRFLRRGRSAVRTEWRLLMATHNLTKLHRHQIATTGA
ncbi:MAG: transposase [Candidatus Dormiibacterota bacterium]